MKTTDNIIRQLYQTTRIISASLNQILEPYGIYHSEWTIIMAIKEKDVMSQIALANYLNIEPPAISKSLVNLERKGLIQRKEGTDKREKTVFLSEEALRQYPQWEKIVGHHRKQILIGLTDERLSELYITLKSVFINAQKIKCGDKIND